MTTGLIGAGLIGIVISAFSITMGGFQTSSRALAQKMEISQLQSNIKGRLSDGNLCGCNLQAAVELGQPLPPPPSPTPQPQAAPEGQGWIGGSGGGMATDRPNGPNPPPPIQAVPGQNFRLPIQNLPTLNIRVASLYGRCANGVPSNPILNAQAAVANSITGLAVDQVNIENFRVLNGNIFSADIVVRWDTANMIVGRKPMTIPLTIQTTLGAGGIATVNSCTTQEANRMAGAGGTPIPPQVAGDPGTQCRYGSTNGPVGVTLYRGAGAHNGPQQPNATPYRLCCLTGSNTGFGQTYGPNDMNFICAAYL